MITLKFVPTQGAPVVNSERLYDVMWSQDRANYSSLGLKVRAGNGMLAERKLLYCFRRELRDKVLSFDLSQAPSLDEAKDDKGKETKDAVH